MRKNDSPALAGLSQAIYFLLSGDTKRLLYMEVYQNPFENDFN